MSEKGYELNKKLSETVSFVFRVHQNQRRKALQIPAWLHLLNVWRILAEYGQKEDLQQAGLLHDSLEDCFLTVGDLKEKFSVRIGHLVEMVSEDEKLQRVDSSALTREWIKSLKCFRLSKAMSTSLPPETRWWIVRKDRFLRKILNCQDAEAIKLLLADKIDNLQSMHRKQLVENEQFWKTLNAGYELQKKYFQKLARIIGQKVKRFNSDLVLEKMFVEFQLIRRQVFGKH